MHKFAKIKAKKVVKIKISLTTTFSREMKGAQELFEGFQFVVLNSC